jgi:hypothetical protein
MQERRTASDRLSKLRREGGDESDESPHSKVPAARAFPKKRAGGAFFE